MVFRYFRAIRREAPRRKPRSSEAPSNLKIPQESSILSERGVGTPVHVARLLGSSGRLAELETPHPFFRGRLGTNARKRRGLSTVIWCSTWSVAPAAFSFGRNTVNVLA